MGWGVAVGADVGVRVGGSVGVAVGAANGVGVGIGVTVSSGVGDGMLVGVGATAGAGVAVGCVEQAARGRKTRTKRHRAPIERKIERVFERIEEPPRKKGFGYLPQPPAPMRKPRKGAQEPNH